MGRSMEHSCDKASRRRGAAQGHACRLRHLAAQDSVMHMKVIYILPVLSLAACTDPAWQLTPDAPGPAIEAAAAVPVETLDPTPPPPPPPAARTVEEFDTTSAEDRAAAVAVVEPAGEQLLGTTNISLGAAADPGIWLKTGLVDTLTAGRVEYPDNGKAISLELRPSGGDSAGSSQMSLAAMRLLDIPLTALADVRVFAN